MDLPSVWISGTTSQLYSMIIDTFPVDLAKIMSWWKAITGSPISQDLFDTIWRDLLGSVRGTSGREAHYNIFLGGIAILVPSIEDSRVPVLCVRGAAVGRATLVTFGGIAFLFSCFRGRWQMP